MLFAEGLQQDSMCPHGLSVSVSCVLEILFLTLVSDFKQW